MLTGMANPMPGLLLVASVIFTPYCRNNATGGRLASRNVYVAPGSNPAAVPASAIAATVASDAYSRWSAVTAQNRAAVAPAE